MTAYLDALQQTTPMRIFIIAFTVIILWTFVKIAFGILKRFKHLHRTGTADPQLLLKLYIAHTNYNLVKTNKKPLRCYVTDDEFFMDDGESNLTQLSFKKSSPGDGSGDEKDLVTLSKILSIFVKAFLSM